MAAMTKKIKLSIIGVVSVIIVFAILYIAQIYPPPAPDSVSGTIGKVDKYRSQQMAEQDVKLRNILIGDSTSVKESIVQLKNYKLFADALQQDMKIWMKQLSAVEQKIKTDQNPEIDVVKEREKQVEEYITFIRANGTVIDKTIGILEKIAVHDTTNPIGDIAPTLTDFETFRVRMNEKFESIVVTIPEINKLLTKNGQLGIINNDGVGLNLVIKTKKQTGNTGSKEVLYDIVLNKELSNRVLYGVGGYYNKESGNSAIGAQALGATALDQKNTLGFIALGRVVLSSAGVGVFVANNEALNIALSKNAQLNCFGNKEIQLGCASKNVLGVGGSGY